MHNDTFLPPRTIKRLEKILYSREKIGAVSPVCKNSLLVANLPRRKVTQYSDYPGLCLAAVRLSHDFGDEVWGQLLTEDICFLAKREAIEETGLFDERLVVRYSESVDYSLRMGQAGWEKLKAEGILVHHQRGATLKINNYDAVKVFDMFFGVLKNKWRVDIKYSGFVRYELIEPIDYLRPDLSVLDIGCAMGGNLAAIKGKRPDARLCGIELNPNAAAIADSFGEIKRADVERLDLPEWKGTFDYIIMGDILEHLREPKALLIKAKSLLKGNGAILASFPNVMDAHVVRGLLGGRWKYEDSGVLDRTHLRFFTKKEMYALFAEAGYEATCYGGSRGATDECLREFLEELRQLKTVKVDTAQMEYVQFFFKAVPIGSKA